MVRFTLWILTGLLVVGCQPSRQTNSDTSAPFTKGQRDFEEFKPIEVPEIVRQRESQRPVEPKPQTSGQVECRADGPFRVLNPKLEINVDTERMTFDFGVESKRGKEQLQLRGPFDKSNSLWRAELYPVDETLLKQRRVQAVALCLTAHSCDVIGINIYYVIENKVYCRQLSTGVEDARIADTGHESAIDELEPMWTLPEAVIGETEDRVSLPPAVEELPSPSRPPEKPPVTKERDTKKANPPEAPKKPKPSLPKDATALKDKVIEYDGPIAIAPPKKSEFRIEQLPEVVVDPKTTPAASYPIQAIRHHANGYLKNATYVPPKGNGFVRRVFYENPRVSPESDRSSAWGTERTREFIEKVGSAVAMIDPDQPWVVTNISSKFGGRLPGHQSHQNGLDIDFRLLYDEPKVNGFHFKQGGKLVPELNLSKNWLLMKAMVSAAQKDWLMVIWTDYAVKQALCKHAQKIGEPINDPQSLAYQTLRVIRHWDAHTNVAHVRLYCPLTEGCRNKLVSIPENNGCQNSNR